MSIHKKLAQIEILKFFNSYLVLDCFFNKVSHLCQEMHLTLNLGTSYKTGLLTRFRDFMFDRIMCILLRIMVRGHFVISIIQFMKLEYISEHISSFSGMKNKNVINNQCNVSAMTKTSQNKEIHAPNLQSAKTKIDKSAIHCICRKCKSSKTLLWNPPIHRPIYALPQFFGLNSVGSINIWELCWCSLKNNNVI